MKRFLGCLLIVSFLTTISWAQAPGSDSLLDSHIQEHRVRASAFVAPTILVTSGIVGHASRHLHQADIDLHNTVVSWGMPKNPIDNALQYLPIASVLALRACGVSSVHQYRDIIPLAAETYIIGAAVVLSVKHFADVQRPDLSAYNSFPSGHTFTAFAGAEILRREYGKTHPLIAIGGYTIATGVGLMRIYNSRHWMADVLAGAGVGILSASAAYWTYPKINSWITRKGCRLSATPVSLTLNF